MTIPNINNIKFKNDSLNVTIDNKIIENLLEKLKNNPNQYSINLYDSGWMTKKMSGVLDLASVSLEGTATLNIPDNLIPYIKSQFIVNAPEGCTPVGIPTCTSEFPQHISDTLVVYDGEEKIFEGLSQPASFSNQPYSLDGSDWRVMKYKRNVYRATFTYKYLSENYPRTRIKNATIRFFTTYFNETEPGVELSIRRYFGPGLYGYPWGPWSSESWAWMPAPIDYYSAVDERGHAFWAYVFANPSLDYSLMRGFEILNMDTQSVTAVGIEALISYMEGKGMIWDDEFATYRFNKTRTFDFAKDKLYFRIAGIKQEFIEPDDGGEGQWITVDADFSDDINISVYDISDVELIGYTPCADANKVISIFTDLDSWKYNDTVGSFSPHDIRFWYDSPMYPEDVTGIFYYEWYLGTIVTDMTVFYNHTIQGEWNYNLDSLWIGPTPISINSERKEYPPLDEYSSNKISYFKNPNGSYIIYFNFLEYLKLDRLELVKYPTTQYKWILHPEESEDYLFISDNWKDDTDPEPIVSESVEYEYLGYPTQEIEVKMRIDIINPFYCKQEWKVDIQGRNGGKDSTDGRPGWGGGSWG